METSQDIYKLEKVQRRATKFILNDYKYSYKSRLLSLNLLPLMYFLELQDILFFVKCIKEPSDNFNIYDYVRSRNRSVHSGKLLVNYTRTTKTRFFYFNRIVKLWNKLPEIDLALSMTSIKKFIFNHLYNHFNQHFCPDIVCTYHYVCPCPNCYHLN